MSLKERLVEDMKAAMKAKEAGKIALSVIRIVRAEIKNTEIDKGRELNDAEVIEVLAREVKRRREAIVEYGKVKRDDIVANLKEKIAVLMPYLPTQLTPDELKRLVQETIVQIGAKDAKDFGKIMGVLMPKVKGRADGKVVSQIVREALGV